MDKSVAGHLPRNRVPLLAFVTATTISTFGNVFTSLSVPWFVLQTTGSAAQAGITGAVTALSFVASFFGGTFVDRLGHKRAAVASDFASGIAVALIPLLHHTVGLAFWQLLVLVFVRALCVAPGNAARQGLIPRLITLAEVRKERANSVLATISNGANLGGAVATMGVVIAVGSSFVATNRHLRTMDDVHAD